MTQNDSPVTDDLPQPERLEYKAIPAPARPVKAKGVKGAAAQFAYGIEEVLNAEAAQGWTYLRAETLPCEERQGLTGTVTTFRSLLVFSRPKPPAKDHPRLDAPQAEATQPAEDK